MVTVDPAKTNILALVRSTPFVSKISVIPDDNSAAYYYDEGVYRLASVVQLLATGISAVGLGFFMISLICSKLIGV